LIFPHSFVPGQNAFQNMLETISRPLSREASPLLVRHQWESILSALFDTAFGQRLLP
jgi:hypothetical protein